MKHSDKSKAPASGWGRETPSSSQDRSRLPARLTWLDSRALCPRGLLLGIDRHSQRPPSPVLLELPLGRGNFCGVFRSPGLGGPRAGRPPQGHLRPLARAGSRAAEPRAPLRDSQGAAHTLKCPVRAAAVPPSGRVAPAEQPAPCEAPGAAWPCGTMRAPTASCAGGKLGRGHSSPPPGRHSPASGLLVMQTLRDTHREAREQPRHRPQRAVRNPSSASPRAETEAPA